jgi:hypothetical protein
MCQDLPNALPSDAIADKLGLGALKNRQVTHPTHALPDLWYWLIDMSFHSAVFAGSLAVGYLQNERG